MLYRNTGLLVLISASLLPAISLDEALTQALANNRRIRLSATRIDQRQQERDAAATRRLPTMSTNITGGISVTRADVTFPRGAFGDFASTGPIPAADQKIGIPRQFSGFAYSQIGLPLTQQARIGMAIDSANLEIGVARSERARTEQEVAAQVRQMYFGLLSADAALRAAQANLDLAREVERLASEGVSAGIALPADRGEAAARRQRSEAVVSNVRAERENLREQFNLLLGRGLDEPAEVTPPADLPPIPTAEEARVQALSNRPELEGARLRIRQAELAARSKRWEMVPDVSLAFQHFGFLNTGNLAPANFAVAGLQLTWEPWDWGRRRKEAKALQYQADAARLALEETADQAKLQASQALRAWEQSQRDLAAAEAAVTAARESVRVSKERFQQQAALLRVLLEAQSTLEAAQEQQVRAYASRGTAWANLQLATGNK